MLFIEIVHQCVHKIVHCALHEFTLPKYGEEKC